MKPHQIEAATALGWPAQSETNIAGWRVFSGLGPVGRVNSCWPLSFDGSDIETAIDAVETHYRAKGLPPQFKLIVDGESPAGLYERLMARGYHTHSHVAVMACAQALPTPSHDVVVTPHVTPAMHKLVMATSLTPLDGQERCEIMSRVPNPSAFGAIAIEGTLAAIGLACIAGETAGIAAMRTLPEHRQRGYARSILRTVAASAFDAGARLLWLQVETDNIPATALYENEGFETLYHYNTLRL